MTEIISDDGHINACLKESNRTAVAHDVWSDASLSQCGRVLSCKPHVFPQQICDTIACKRLFTGIPEEAIIGLSGARDPTKS
jgi:hypothetical protein